MIDYKTVAEDSNMIINGYAFTKEDKNIRVLNLNLEQQVVAMYDHLVKSDGFVT